MKHETSLNLIYKVLQICFTRTGTVSMKLDSSGKSVFCVAVLNNNLLTLLCDVVPSQRVGVVSEFPLARELTD